MNEEMIKVFDYIGNKLGVAIDYTQENIQPYLEDLWNRFITYELVINIIFGTIGAVLLIVGFITIYKYFKASKLAQEGKADGFFYKIQQSIYSDKSVVLNDMSIAILIVMLFAIFIGLVLFIVHISSVIELLIVPEKFIFELIKG